jgi:hypothetical protein
MATPSSSTTKALYNTVSTKQAVKSNKFITQTDRETNGLKQNSQEDQNILSLRQQLIAAEKIYNDYFKKMSDNVQNYIDRVDPKKDSYLNTNVTFGNGDTAYVTNQGVAKLYPNGQFGNMKGQNGCPASSKPLKVKNDPNINSQGSDLNSLTPHLRVGTPMISNQQCGNEGANIMVASVLPNNIPDPTYVGCYSATSNQKMSYIGDDGRPTNTKPAKGMHNYDTCKTAAIYNGNRYFAVQDADTNGLGYCTVSSNVVPLTDANTSYIVTGTTVLWTSGLPTNVGHHAEFTNTGGLIVKDTNGGIQFNTEGGSNYLGCFLDNRGDGRNFPRGGNGKIYNYDTCKKLADEGGYTYFGLQNESANSSSGPNGTQAECWMGSDNDYASLLTNPKYPQINSGNSGGGYYNCHLPSNKKDRSGKMYGGPSVNAVYSTDPIGTYYLLITDSGSISIYKGEHIPPSGSEYVDSRDKKMWSFSGTSKDPDPAYASSAGKYHSNCVVANKSTPAVILMPGEFIGSTTGKTYLKFEKAGPYAGNLVLYTSTRKVNCTLDKNKYTVGGVNANSVYDIKQVGVPGDLGSAGFVDENSVLHQYPSNLVGVSNNPNAKNEYIQQNGLPISVNNNNIALNSVTGNIATSSYKTLVEAQQKCNTMPTCNSILSNGNLFVLFKNKYGEPTVPAGPTAKTYFRIPEIMSSGSCPKQFVPVDSLTWERYKNNGGGLGKPMASDFDCAFGQMNIVNDPTLLSLQKNVDDLRKKITSKSNSLVKRSGEAQNYHIGSTIDDHNHTASHTVVKSKKEHEKDSVVHNEYNSHIKHVNSTQKQGNSKVKKNINQDNSRVTYKKMQDSSISNAKAIPKQFLSSEIWTPVAPKQGFTNMNSVINRIVNDSSIQVSQKNYEYILWIVLAMIIIAISIRLYRIKTKV